MGLKAVEKKNERKMNNCAIARLFKATEEEKIGGES